MMHISPLLSHHCEALARLDYHISPRPWTQAMFAEELGAQSVALVAQQDRVLLGFAIARDQYASWHVMTLGVDPQQRRQGYGGQLMRALIQGVAKRGGAELELEVRASNGAAIGLYEQLGFKHLGVRPRYYPLGQHGREDAVLMGLALGADTINQ
ncbi:[SSU ribosomal protein S18P]-alanine acetyltransferase [Magnetococcus marinus MC-1]|uniref:[Ribosomal protein bS18]-alanine N-acetyltransferase n=1 Tax=Magnetococcus marinus (strain ATCC BAA-1437 / JCM 17883 / MC-1) TaxID=156889 RepID=A0L5B6_MAGMM|nr:ribosomal protein S18-alanine N-acetyltransferase [Magnetococcus marinus]ABK43159.1 [SSU ribosomal protein S18P]-alanine acetyltransferase [Magnetococcus marinus MC-1]